MAAELQKYKTDHNGRFYISATLPRSEYQLLDIPKGLEKRKDKIFAIGKNFPELGLRQSSQGVDLRAHSENKFLEENLVVDETSGRGAEKITAIHAVIFVDPSRDSNYFEESG